MNETNQVEEKKIPEKFLPIGTVVMLKGGKRPVMVCCCCIMPTGEVYDKDGKVKNVPKVIDYGGCFYPEGMIKSDQMFGFNHDMIDKVIFLGYQSDKQKEYSNNLKEGLAEFQKKLEAEKQSNENRNEETSE